MTQPVDTVKHLDELYKTGVYSDGSVGYEPGADGLIDLAYKDDATSVPETRFGFGYTLYARIDTLTELQQRVIEMVSNSLGPEYWRFRQARDLSIGDEVEELMNPLKRPRTHSLLVLFYQREKQLPDIPNGEWSQYFRTEQDVLAEQVINQASAEINALVDPRFFLRGVDVAYEFHDDWGRSGEGGEDIRLLTVALYFDDKKEDLLRIRKDYAAKERALSRLGERIGELEALLKDSTL